MSDSPAIESSPGVKSADPKRANRLLSRVLGTLLPVAARSGALLAFILGANIMFAYKPFIQMERNDFALYDYAAQAILRGDIPYRDFVDGKAPGAWYISAASMAVARKLGFRDIDGVRFMEVMMGGIFIALIFLVAKDVLDSSLSALVACSIPLISTRFILSVIGGTQPKLPMAIFGLLTLLLIKRDRPFAAGFCSMLSCLCWQPGLLFTGVAILVLSRYLTSWRDRRALRVAAGAALPLAVFILYFYFNGALGDLWSWTITYNHSVYVWEMARSLREVLRDFKDVAIELFESASAFLLLTVAGFVICIVERIKKNLRSLTSTYAPSESFRDAVLISPLIYIGFCFAHPPGYEDFIPLIPFVGIFTAWFLPIANRFVSSKIPANSVIHPLRRIEVLSIVLLLLIVPAARRHGKSYRVGSNNTLRAQDRQFSIVSDLLGPEDKIYCHRGLELLVLLNKPNLNRYVMLDRGKDSYLDSTLPGGFAAVLEQIESEAPKVVVITQLGHISHRDEIRSWLEEHYEPLPLRPEYDRVLQNFDKVYVRKAAGNER